MKQKFQAPLIKPEATGNWTYINVPFSVEQAFGFKGQVKVRGTINDFPYRSSVMPRGDGTHYMVVNKEVRAGAAVDRDDVVNVVMEPDLEERIVALPAYLMEALKNNPTSLAAYNKLSYSHQKEYIDWVTAAKKEETTARRI